MPHQAERKQTSLSTVIIAFSCRAGSAPGGWRGWGEGNQGLAFHFFRTVCWDKKHNKSHTRERTHTHQHLTHKNKLV